MKTKPQDTKDWEKELRGAVDSAYYAQNGEAFHSLISMENWFIEFVTQLLQSQLEEIEEWIKNNKLKTTTKVKEYESLIILEGDDLLSKLKEMKKRI